MNILNMIQLLTSNPQQTINKALGNTPMSSNLIKMINGKDQKGIEQMARNLAKEKGIDADQMFNKIKNQFGVK